MALLNLNNFKVNDHVTHMEHGISQRFRAQMQSELNERFVVFNPLYYVEEEDGTTNITIQININRYIQLRYKLVKGSYNDLRSEKLSYNDTIHYIGVKVLNWN